MTNVAPVLTMSYPEVADKLRVITPSIQPWPPPDGAPWCERGFYGGAIDIAIRLLDSPRLKLALKGAAAPLVLVVSGEIYSGNVCHGHVAAY